MPEAHPRGSRFAVATLSTSIFLLTALAVALAQGSQEGATTTGVSTGVYTSEQAERGAEVFLTSCAGCHGPELQGGFGPQLAPLGEHWLGGSLGSLYSFVSSAMPYSAPGSLEPQQYADVLAFVLQENGYQAGDAELVPDAEALAAFTFDTPAEGANDED